MKIPPSPFIPGLLDLDQMARTREGLNGSDIRKPGVLEFQNRSCRYRLNNHTRITPCQFHGTARSCIADRKCRANASAPGAATDQTRLSRTRRGSTRHDRTSRTPFRWRRVYLLDLRRRRSRQFHPSPRGRRDRISPEQPPNQPYAAQYRFTRGDGAGRRGRFVLYRAGSFVPVFVQGIESRALRLSLRDRSGWHAYREWHVWIDTGRTGGWIASSRSRVLRDAERILYPG